MTSLQLLPATPGIGEHATSGGSDHRYQMPAYVLGTAGRAMTRELLWFVLLGIIALSVPIIIISLRVHLSSFALPFERFWHMTYAISCMILVHTIPEITAVVTVAIYARFLSEGAVSTLFSAGRSPLAVVFPAAVVAFCAMLLVLVISTIIAPVNAKYIHDTLLFLRRDFNLNMLDAGVFHDFKNENITIFFKRKIETNQIGDVFIAKYVKESGENGKKEEIYTAKRAIVVGTEGDRALLLIDGNALITNGSDEAMRKVEYDRAIWRPDSGFAAPTRSNTFFDEVSTVDLLTIGPDAASERRSARMWLREVVWRFLSPVLTLTHTLLGLGLLMTFSPIAGRNRTPYLVAIVVCAVTFALHILFTSLVELLARIGLAGAVLLLGIIAVQACVGVTLLTVSQNPDLQRRAMVWSAALLRIVGGRATASTASDQDCKSV